jgi:chromosome segregation ATPase
MSNKIKRDSPLVKSVLALDTHLSELERVGTKIKSTDMTSEFDVEYVQKLMARFAECGQGVSEEVTNLSRHLQEARARAEAVAEAVSNQAELFNARRNEEAAKLEQFRILGERVRDLNTSLQNQTQDLPAFETQLAALIDELQELRKSARSSRMKALEKNAESLSQMLEALRTKLSRGLHG